MNINVKVVPQAGRQKIVLDKNGTIKCYLNSPAEDGKANHELIKLLAESLNIPQRQVAIMQGQTSRNKVIAIDGIDSLATLYDLLGLQVQTTLF